MGFQDSWWNISRTSLMILAAAVFEISCMKDRQTDKRRYAIPTPATAVDVGKYIASKLRPEAKIV